MTIIIVIIITKLRTMFCHEMAVRSASCSDRFYLPEKRSQYALEKRWGASIASLYAAVANGPIRMLLQFSVLVRTELSKITKYLKFAFANLRERRPDDINNTISFKTL